MYDSYISINNRFKSSINLQFDLNNLEKVDEYIPTTDLCDVIKKFIISALGKNEDRSTILVGPYGKGKSYLMLIIIYILSIKETSTNAKKTFNEFVTKVMNVDKELAKLISDIESQQIHLLPVIINSNYSHDLNQIFMLSLINTLENNNIKNITPDTSFTEALKIIEKWEKSSNDSFNIFETCLKEKSIDLEILKSGLYKYDIVYYKLFEDLYDCVTHGAKFNPFIGNDFVSTYSSVVHELCKKTDYKGLFVIFDEFGFFLENQTIDFSERLKNIEYMAEKCKDDSVYKQMHFCCITHKDFVLYSKGNTLYNSFIKVAGRFKKLEFDRSLDENYDIISGAIKKNDNYKELVNENSYRYLSLLDKINRLGIYNQRKNVFNVFKNSFPFNPVALYSLIQVSEKIGQNERTLFTFLSENDTNSFKYFITNNNSGLINADLIYDYFENTIKNNEETYYLYSSVEVAKRLCLKIEEHQIFKAIAIIRIINDNSIFPCTKENIELSLGCYDHQISNQIDSLLKNNTLKQNVYDRTIDFTILADKLINDKINELVNTKFASININESINSLKVKKYFVSHKYNFENYMTRFFEGLYVSTSDFKKLGSLDYYFSNIKADGLLINLINDGPITAIQIKKLLEKSKRNIIVRYTDKELDELVVRKLRIYSAAKYLLDRNANLSPKEYESIMIYLDDLVSELSYYFDETYAESNCFCLISDSNKLEECIYLVLSSCYNQTIKLNNELINKDEITKTSKNTRNNVVDAYLFDPEKNFGKTSAEATIKLSFENSLSVSQDIIKFLKDLLLDNAGEKVSINDLVSHLVEPPYGIRKGLLPLFLAYTISLLNIHQGDFVNAVLLYRDETEIDLNANALDTVINSSNRYYLCYEKVNGEQYKLTKDLLELFKCKESGNFASDIKCLVASIRDYIHNLPPIFSKTTKNDNLLELSDSEIKFISLFLNKDLNNYKTLFETLPAIFGLNYKNIVKKFRTIQVGLLTKLEQFYQKTINNLKQKFVKTEGSIYSSYSLWKNEHRYVDEIIFENEFSLLFNSLNAINYDDKSAINMLSNVIVRCTLEDWNTSKQELFNKKIDEFVRWVNNFDVKSGLTKEKINEYVPDSIELSSLAETLYDNLISSLDEYGSAISKEEKIKILKKLLKSTIE